jgi:site-specific recombinase XerD
MGDSKADEVEERTTIQAAIRNHLEALEVDNASKYTLKQRLEHLNWFAEWVRTTNGITYADELRVIHLRGWIAHLQKRLSQHGGGKLSDASIQSYGRSLMAFCHWLEKEEVIGKPITTHFRLPRMEKKFVPTFTHDEVERLLAACEADSRYRPQMRRAMTARNRAMLSVLIDTGIRRSELAGLRLGDIDRELRLLLVHRKGNKWQQVPISQEGFKPLHDYLAKIGSNTVAKRGDTVFLSEHGKLLTPAGVSHLFETLEERAGIEGKRVSPHNCRRYMATTQLASVRSPLDVQRQMGHSTLTMTNHCASFVTYLIK